MAEDYSGVFRRGAGWLAGKPLARRAWSDRTLHLFGADADVQPRVADVDIRVDDWGHIERFEQCVSWLTRETFVAACARRIDNGSHVFTVADRDGPLLGYGYVHPGAKDSLYSEVNQRVYWPARTATSYGDFVHPKARGRGLHSALQNAKIVHSIQRLGMSWLISAVDAANGPALASARKAAFRQVADLRTRYRLGRAVKSARLIDSRLGLSFAIDA